MDGYVDCLAVSKSAAEGVHSPVGDFFVSSRPPADGRHVLRGGRGGRLCRGGYVVGKPRGCASGPYVVGLPCVGHPSSSSFLLSRPPLGKGAKAGGGGGGGGGDGWNDGPGVYVLEKPGGEYYVGKSANIGERLRQHASGSGATCARGSVRRVAPMTPALTWDLEAWERAETLARMRAHGISKVRGWMYTSPVLSDAEREHAFHQVCEKHDLCRRCGAEGHFAAKCDRKGGGALGAFARPLWART